MKSGVHFSAIFIIWIIGLISATYLLYPDIQKSINSYNNIDLEPTVDILNVSNDSVVYSKEELVNYTPIGVVNIFNK